MWKADLAHLARPAFHVRCILMNILVKSGIEQLPLFEKENFSCFEAYLRGDEELPRLLATKMRLVAIHMPHTVKYRGQRWPIDFVDAGTAGEASFQKLKGIVEFSAQHEVSYVVLHLGFFNSLHEDRWKTIERVAQRFAALHTKKVKICLENVPGWTNICFEHEPLLRTAEHFLYFKARCPSVEAVLDVDHLAINATFDYFYDSYRKRYVSAEYASAEQKKNFLLGIMEPEMQEAVRQTPDVFKERVDKELVHFLSSVKPVLVHAVGSDYCNYRHDGGQLPLLGEALPLGFKGTIKGSPVEDRLDHALWLSRLPQKTWITIELMLRSEYDYIGQIRKSVEYLSTKTSL